MNSVAQLFFCYAREDEEYVDKLYEKLSLEGFKPWMDKQDIVPGENWKLSIQKAIKNSDFFLIFLSTKSVNKRGFLQREIKNALDLWQEQLENDIYLIPIRLEECKVPPNLSEFQWVDLFETNGIQKLIDSLNIGMKRRGLVEESGGESHEETVIEHAARLESSLNFKKKKARFLNSEEGVKAAKDEIKALQFELDRLIDSIAESISLKLECNTRQIKISGRDLNLYLSINWQFPYIDSLKDSKLDVKLLRLAPLVGSMIPWGEPIQTEHFTFDILPNEQLCWRISSGPTSRIYTTKDLASFILEYYMEKADNYKDHD